MADDDDEKGSRDNTGRDSKPKSAQNRDNAPTGSLGTNKLTPQSPGLGGSTKRRKATQALEQSGKVAEPAQSQATTPEKDDRPIAVKTDVTGIDQQSEKDGFQLKSLDEIKALAGTKEETQKPQGPRILQSDFAKAFRTARDQTRDMHQSTGPHLK